MVLGNGEYGGSIEVYFDIQKSYTSFMNSSIYIQGAYFRLFNSLFLNLVEFLLGRAGVLQAYCSYSYKHITTSMDEIDVPP